MVALASLKSVSKGLSPEVASQVESVLDHGDAATTKAHAHALFESLEPLAKTGDVFEAFEALDALPHDVVAAVLAAQLGSVRAPEELDSSTRLAHDFAPPALRFVCTRVVRPSRLEQLSPAEQQQVESTGKSWDGASLPAAARMADDGTDSVLPSLEHWTIDDEDGVPQLEIVRHHGDSGAIFRAGTTDVIGIIAHGTVELADRRERKALQAALDAPVDEEVVVSRPMPVLAPAAPAAPDENEESVASPVTKPTAKLAPAARRQLRLPLTGEESETADAFEPEPTTTKMKRPAKAKAKAEKAKPAKKAAAAAPAKKKSAAAAATTKKAAAAKKTSATTKATAAKKPAAAKKTAAKKPAAPKKTAAKKPAAKKPAAKKTAAKKPASSK